jgi:cytochrome b561
VSEDLKRYSAVAAALHWAIAILILFNLGFGFFMEGFKMPLKFLILDLHISSGITVLALTVVRIVWRLTHRPPPFAPGLSPLESGAAHVVHFLLYAAMLLMPLTGWSIISAHQPNPHFAGMGLWFSPVHLPSIGPIANLEPHFQAQMHANFVTAHTIGGYILLALLVLHVAGALKHQFLDGHREFARMGFGKAL